MNRLVSFIQSTPLRINLLFLIYIVSLYRKISVILQPELTTASVMIFSIIELVLALMLLVLLIKRKTWTWRLGIFESVLSAIVSTILLFQGRSIIEHATEEAIAKGSYSDLTPAQTELAMQIGLYSGISFVILGAIVTAILWYRSKPYFNKGS